MWFKIENKQVKLSVFAKPNAKKTALKAISEHELHIALHAKPHHGEANTELISYLAKIFQLPKSKIILQRGEGSRHKLIIVPLTRIVQQLIDDPSKFM